MSSVVTYPRITKAIFPVAGLGTRFLPATKASPKEMLPIVDKPLIQYAAEEAVAAGITDLIFVTGRNKRSIEDHFDSHPELEMDLKSKNKFTMLEIAKNILPANINCIYIRQPEALGLGHAIYCAQSLIGNDPFAIILADELLRASPSGLGQLIDVYEQTGRSVLGVDEVEDEVVSSYGIVKSEEVAGECGYNEVNFIVEKPQKEEAPSNLAVIGRYIMTPAIFRALAKITPGNGGEMQLTDAISLLLQSEKVYCKKINGIRYDCGSKLGYLKATVEFALNHPEVGGQFEDYLMKLTAK